MEKVVRFGVWTVFGFGFVVLAAVAALTALTAKPALAQAQKGVKSKISVTVPQDDAELQIEKKVMKTTGKVREFDTPELEAKKMYEYEFVATWRPNNYTVITRTRVEKFVAGDNVTVDLTKEPKEGDPRDKAVIRFVPTPDDIVAEMIKLAKVGKDDVVFEPGCGDGRIIVASVKAGAKRAVGIDLDEERVKESLAAVKAAGLGDKIDIRKGDALEVKDYGDATVVMLYMGDEFDLLVRPILLRELKIGTRIVSHRFLMGDWKPDTTKTLTGKEDGEEYLVHLWTVTEDAKKKYAAPAKK
jgi:uncharacterized protein (TIGR03000 family)